MPFERHAMVAGEGFFRSLAESFFERAERSAAAAPYSAPRGSVSCGSVSCADFSVHLFFAPSLPLAAECRTALIAAARRPMLLPRFDTLSRWAFNTPLPDEAGSLAAQPDSARLLLLYDALAARGWFDPAALWSVAAELAALADELSAAAVTLPDDFETLLAQLRHAYELTAAKPLIFEARLVHEMWRALSACGQPDRPSLYRLRLARLAATVEVPLTVLLAGAPEEVLSRAEIGFFEACAARREVVMFYPAPRGACATPLARLLAAAWPENVKDIVKDMEAVEGAEGVDMPLIIRARDLRAAVQQSPLAGRLGFAPASGREAEAQTIAAQTLAWLREGKQRIALISADRLSARRVRALLEREEVLVDDETGWKLSTSRAAALVDALLECAAGNAARGTAGIDLLDLVKSPFLAPMAAPSGYFAAVAVLERAIRDSGSGGFRRGTAYFRRMLRRAADMSAALPDAETDGNAHEQAVALLDRIDAALHLLSAGPAPLARWLERLDKALEALGAHDNLAVDAAGAVLLELLTMRREELAPGGTENTFSRIFSFSAWRHWLNRELENANFHESGIESPVVMLPLSTARLRSFDAAVLIGGDAASLAAGSTSAFFNQAVRRDLGLPTREAQEAALLRDLELLFAAVPRVLVTWCLERDGEANSLAPPLDLLATLHGLAWPEAAAALEGKGGNVAEAEEANRENTTIPPSFSVTGDDAAVSEEIRLPVLALGDPPQRALPSIAPHDLPQRLPVAALISLVACPYQFFARYVLRLGEMEEMQETFGKSDYGILVHRILEIFHRRHPWVTALAPEAALASLEEIGNEVFAAAETEDFFVAGWRLRWQACFPSYLEWQRENEAAGWRWQQGEVKVSRLLPLEGNGESEGGTLEIHGRIDRVDVDDEGVCALFDYKTQTASALRKRQAEDVQLPLYALIHGNVKQAAYLALDDARVSAVEAALTPAGEIDGEIGNEAPLLRHFSTLFSRIRAGTAMPAHGADTVCAWCEMRGVCRIVYARNRNA